MTKIGKKSEITMSVVFLIGLSWLLTTPVLAVTCKSGEAIDPNTGACVSVEMVENLNCFSEDECNKDVAPYYGTPSKTPVSECQNDQRAKDEGRLYYCYAPRPKICQPGSKDTNCAVNLEVSIGGQTITGLEGYVAALYKWLVAISGILAGMMIVYAGIKWMLASGNPEKINEAKHKVGDAVIGLILVVGSYVIMQTINPALVSLQMPPIKLARQLGVSTQGKCTLKGISQQDLEKQDADTKKTYKEEIACGEKFNCANLPAACGGMATGTCVGQLCETGGCYDIDTNKAVSIMGSSRQLIGELRTVLSEVAKSKQVCVEKTTDCNCSAINKQMNENKGNYMYNYQAARQCLANICDCVLFEYTSKDSSHAVVECQEKWQDGDECVYGGDPIDAICFSGLCNSKTRKCTRGDPVGVDCKRDKECQSGICNSGSGECTPLRGEPEGVKCGVDRDCQLDLACNTGMGGTCQKKQGKGEFCGKGGDCQSGQCSGVLGGVGSVVNIRKCE